jgi:transcription-repair coupling factor (superfamily II helicase)
MTYYRRLALARAPGDVDAIESEMIAHAGPPPEEARALVDVIRLRILARAAGVASISRHDGRFSIRFDGPPFDESVQRMLRSHLRADLRGRVQVTPGGITVRPVEKAFADQIAALGEFIGHVGRLVARNETAAASDAELVDAAGRSGPAR